MISVSLMLRTGRKHWECQWISPVTGKKKTKSTKTANRREAERFLGALEHKLNSEQYEERENAEWKTVADRYDREVLAGLAPTTRRKFSVIRNSINTIISPKMAAALTASQISKYQTALRDKGTAEATIKSYLVALRTCLKWADRVGLMGKVPHFEMPKRTGKMKGRPITPEEYDRMKEAIPKVIGADHAASWEYLIEGLWLSALRLDEALRLTWDGEGFSISFSGKRPRFRIEVLNDKSKKARLLPMTPEFGRFLMAVPPHKRHGTVFRPTLAGQKADMRIDTCSKKICDIGEKAKILVAEYPPRPGENERRKKWASAHDLRRYRLKYWSRRLRPDQLKELARHASIETTMTYYVGEDLDETEDAMWEHCDVPANTAANSNLKKTPAKSKKP